MILSNKKWNFDNKHVGFCVSKKSIVITIKKEEVSVYV